MRNKKPKIVRYTLIVSEIDKKINFMFLFPTTPFFTRHRTLLEPKSLRQTNLLPPPLNVRPPRQSPQFLPQ